MALLSRKIREQARRNRVRYSFLFMHAERLAAARDHRAVDAGVLRPVIDRVFASTDTSRR